jgi:glycine hydroxymethyltransferase
MSLPHGGHLTHGWKVNFSGRYYNAVQYGVDLETELIDFAALRKLAKEHKPKVIWTGATAYPRVFDWQKFKDVASEIGAYLVADISHISGLIIAGAHPTPVGIADVIMTTTHKTLRGPRGSIIMTDDEELATKIDKAVFPGLQGGPHDNNTAAIAVCLKEASTADFRKYGQQIVKNAKVLAETLTAEGLRLVSGGTDNHLMLVDFGESGPTGKEIQEALNLCGIIVNKNTVPRETRKPFVTSGIRLGTPAVTTRVMKEKEMRRVGLLISKVIKGLEDEKVYKKIHRQVKSLTSKFPVP